MTKARVASEGNRRVVAAPSEQQAEFGASGTDSPMPPTVSAPRPRRTGRGLLRAIGRVAALGLVLGGTSAGAVLGTYHFAKTSPRFSVRQIDVQGLRRKSRDAIVELSQLGLDRNIFSVDTAQVEQRILRDPWIREVKVERRLPGTIQIDLVERDALALALHGDQLLLVTRTGETFKRYEASDPADLPVITGIELQGSAEEPGLERRRIATALEVLRHYERSSISRQYPAQEVHLTPGGEVSLTVGKSGIALHLGLGPWAKKLAMAERIFAKLRSQKGNVGMVFLDNRAHPERVVVRMK